MSNNTKKFFTTGSAAFVTLLGLTPGTVKSTSKMIKGMSTILFGLTVVVFASEAFAQGTWTTKAPMPTARVYAGAGVIDGRFYVVGGQHPGGSTTTANEVYDPTTDTWMAKAPALTSRGSFGVGVINGKLYAVGGCIYSDCNNVTNILEMYDPATNAWVSKAPLPTALFATAVGTIGGKLYVAGGRQCTQCSPVSTLNVYDPTTNTWVTKAPMLTARTLPGYAVVNDILYVAGGNEHPLVNVLEAYNPTTDTWTANASMPTTRSYTAADAINGLIYVVGGYNGAIQALPTVEAYDTATDSWSSEAPMPTGRYVPVAGTINGVLYVVGGANALNIPLNTNEVFTPGPANLPPTAVPGVSQVIHAGQTVNLNGSGSFDDNTPSASLQYAWTIMAKPVGSIASLTNANTATPSFVADKVGTYTIQLVVTDQGGLSSPPATVNVSSENLLPTANAGNNNSTIVGTAVSFDGSGSSDPNNDPLSYAWTIVAAPAGSTATLSAANSQTPSFTPDIPGQYTVGLIVNDGFGDSPQAQVTLTAISAADYAQGQSSAAINTIASLTIAQLQAPGHKNSLSNLISQAIAALQIGDIATAKSKLSAAISRTDGYPLRGAIDTKGPGMDWVTDPVAQASIYQALKNALDVLP